MPDDPLVILPRPALAVLDTERREGLLERSGGTDGNGTIEFGGLHGRFPVDRQP
jgi:hypothetical protein